VIEHGTRRIRVLGATENPAQSWIVQQARNLLMDLADAGMSVKCVLHDRDASFTGAFDAVFQAAGARVVRSVIQAPRMNAYAERWVRTVRAEVTDRTLDRRAAAPAGGPGRVCGALQRASPARARDLQHRTATSAQRRSPAWRRPGYDVTGSSAA
jgi:hypothetical protein